MSPDNWLSCKYSISEILQHVLHKIHHNTRSRTNQSSQEEQQNTEEANREEQSSEQRSKQFRSESLLLIIGSSSKRVIHPATGLQIGTMQHAYADAIHYTLQYRTYLNVSTLISPMARFQQYRYRTNPNAAVWISA
jgi:hypothetical protein